jgi:hypothetical protein
MAKRKYLDLIMLLMISVFVVSASAAVYYSLDMESEITVGTTWVKFVNATDTPAEATVEDSYCMLPLITYPNATVTYEHVVGLNNTDGSDPHSVRLRSASVTPDAHPDVGNFTSITFYLLDASNNTQTTFEYNQTSNTWNIPPTTGYYSIPAGTEWFIKVETVSPIGAQSGVDCTIVIAIDVQ